MQYSCDDSSELFQIGNCKRDKYRGCLSEDHSKSFLLTLQSSSSTVWTPSTLAPAVTLLWTTRQKSNCPGPKQTHKKPMTNSATRPPVILQIFMTKSSISGTGSNAWAVNEGPTLLTAAWTWGKKGSGCCFAVKTAEKVGCHSTSCLTDCVEIVFVLWTDYISLTWTKKLNET